MLVIVLFNCLVVVLSVTIHYEFLSRLSEALPKIKIKQRAKIILGVFAALIAHAIEIWVFALAYYLKHKNPRWGHLEGNFDGSMLDCVYYSFTSFTTLGFGDIVPIGDIRYMTGIESLTGLVLITWTASYLFLEMQKHWN